MKKGKQIQRVDTVESTYRVWGWIVLFWAFYRYFFQLPEWVDEFVIKPLVFVVPVWVFVAKKTTRPWESLGLTTKNLRSSVYIGLGFGLIFALEGLAANALKYGKLDIVPIEAVQQYGIGLMFLLSLATAFSEEVLSRGFVFRRFVEGGRGVIYAAFLSTVMFLVLHIPILAFSLKLNGTALILFFVTDFILGFANSLLLYNSGSLVAPILVHVFWNMTVALYL